MTVRERQILNSASRIGTVGKTMTLTRLAAPVFLICLISAGCQGLTPGKMESVQPYSEAPRAGNVYLIRGLIGVFSTGMDELSEKITQSGVRAHVFQDNQHSQLANAIVKQYKGVKNPEPLCLVGHSYGADDVVRVSQVLQEHGIKVDLLVTVDATVPPPVPPNVAVCYNYYQSQVTDFIPMFRGIPLKQEVPGSGTLVNMDLRKDRKDLLTAGTNHINIDKNTRIQDLVVTQVIDACPTRQVWLAQIKDIDSPEAQKAGAVVPGARSARPTQAQRTGATEFGP